MSARHGWPGGDVHYRCHHCGSVHEAEAIRRNLYLGQRALGDAAAFEHGGVRGLGRRIVRRRVTRSLMRALWGN